MPNVSTDLRFASALSDEPNIDQALLQTTTQIEAQLEGRVDLLMVFASSHHAAYFDAMAAHFAASLRPQVMLGATAQGVLGTGVELQVGPGLSVMAASMPAATLHPFQFDQIDWRAAMDDPGQVRRLPGADDAKAVVLLADPFSVAMSPLLAALSAALPHVPVAGGMVSGSTRPHGNRLLFNGEVHDAGGMGLIIGGGIEARTTVSQGTRPIGRPHVISGCRRHVVLELDGHNALEQLTRTIGELGDDERELARMGGLVVGRVIDEYKPHYGRGDFLIRNVLRIDEQRGYLVINDTNVRRGQTIQFHIRDPEAARDDLNLMLSAQRLHGLPAGAMLFTCTGRGLNLFDYPDADALMVSDALGEAPMAGFFADGQVGQVGDRSLLHGHTASLIAFRPAPGLNA